jgi:hypothetical protein
MYYINVQRAQEFVKGNTAEHHHLSIQLSDFDHLPNKVQGEVRMIIDINDMPMGELYEQDQPSTPEYHGPHSPSPDPVSILPHITTPISNPAYSPALPSLNTLPLYVRDDMPSPLSSPMSLMMNYQNPRLACTPGETSTKM